MPRQCTFRRFVAGQAAGVVLRVALRVAAACRWPLGCAPVAGLVLPGCNIAQLAEAPLPPDAAVLPSPELNPDLVKVLKPSNDRQWEPDQAVLAYAEIDGDRVTVHNIRNCDYLTAENYIVRHYDKTFDLDRLQSVDFIVAPFKEMPLLAHTMLSFGFAGGDHLGVSVEIRKEKGEKFDTLKGFLRQYELMYVVGDERDLIGLRANHRLDDVYVYRTRASPAEARDLFLDVMRRVNKLYHQPEFYDTLTNNCTTNVRHHVNRLAPDRVPYDYRVLFPGYADHLAYDLGLLETDTTFEETRRRARVNYLAYLHRDDPEFSLKIRQ